MAVKCLLVIVLCKLLFFPIHSFVNANMHWVVTEDGRIQSQVDSVFNMQRPYDLMALLKQEQRLIKLETLKSELLARKSDIDKSEDKDAGLEQRFYASDSDCITAGKPLVEFDLYVSTSLPLEEKGILMEDHIGDLSTSSSSVALESPNCISYIPLDFSMHSFEHLEGVRLRDNLTMTQESGLRTLIGASQDVELYGHLVHEALLKNSTSWVLYNLAALYWRIKGDPYHAIECLRRALHVSPREHKDLALISLGNILHHTRYSNEAAVVVHSALDISHQIHISHFTLANIYAVLAEYNKSVICFDNTLKLKSDFEPARERKHAVLCHSKLEAMLEYQHKSLRKTLAELKDYQEKHDEWQAEQQKLLSEQAKVEEKITQRISYEAHRIRLVTEEAVENLQLLHKVRNEL